MSGIKENLAGILERIQRAAEVAGRTPDSVKLLAVSKTFPLEDVLEAYGCGQRMFGENRPQELQAKAPKAPEDCQWHLIGHLQKNKVRTALQHAGWIHSVDSVELLDRINRIAGELSVVPNLLLEVNISGEESKFGLIPDAVEEVVNHFQGGTSICRGLMTVAPADADSGELRKIFAGLRELRDRLEGHCGVRLPELSMGMTGDFAEAIAEGATIVRVGSGIFGHRDYGVPRP